MSQIAGSFQDRSVGRGHGGQTDGSPTLLMSAIVKMTPISDSFRRMEVAYPGVGLLNRGRTGGG